MHVLYVQILALVSYKLSQIDSCIIWDGQNAALRAFVCGSGAYENLLALDDSVVTVSALKSSFPSVITTDEHWIGLDPDYNEFFWIRNVNRFKKFEAGPDLDWVSEK